MSSPPNSPTIELDCIRAGADRSAAVGRAPAVRVYDACAPLKLWHLASFDAPTVAVVWSLGFARAADVRLPAWVLLLTALVTWAVYIGDRLLDARSGARSGQHHRLRERHFFHWRHRRSLIPLSACAATAAAAIVLSLMPAQGREHDSYLGIAALAYFSGVHARPRLPGWLRRLIAKEFLVGILFTAGCALPALSRAHLFSGAFASHLPLCAAVFFFAALAWLNCHAIECWESAGTSRIVSLASGLGIAGLLLASLLALVQSRSATLFAAGAASALMLALLGRVRTRLTPVALRAAADLVLLTPLLLVLRTP